MMSDLEAANPALAPVSVNGNAPGPQVRRREEWKDLPTPYDGFQIKIWANYPRKLATDVNSNDVDLMLPALMRIILEHNHWRDEQGDEYPAANTEDFWRAIPDELAAALITLFQMEALALPNSMMQSRLNSISSSARSLARR
jgi:hypothetical protein